MADQDQPHHKVVSLPPITVQELEDGGAQEWIRNVKFILLTSGYGGSVYSVFRQAGVQGVASPAQSGVGAAGAPPPAADAPSLSEKDSLKLYGLLGNAVKACPTLSAALDKVEFEFMGTPCELGPRSLKAVLDFYREAPALSLHDVKREFVKNMAETDCTTAAEYLALVEATASRANHMEVNTYSDADVASQVVNGLSPHFSPIMMELYKNRQERDLAAVRAAIRTIGPMLNKQLQQQHGGQPGASAFAARGRVPASPQPGRGQADMVCFNCDQPGHGMDNCPHPTTGLARQRRKAYMEKKKGKRPVRQPQQDKAPDTAFYAGHVVFGAVVMPPRPPLTPDSLKMEDYVWACDEWVEGDDGASTSGCCGGAHPHGVRQPSQSALPPAVELAPAVVQPTHYQLLAMEVDTGVVSPRLDLTLPVSDVGHLTAAPEDSPAIEIDVLLDSLVEELHAEEVAVAQRRAARRRRRGAQRDRRQGGGWLSYLQRMRRGRAAWCANSYVPCSDLAHAQPSAACLPRRLCTAASFYSHFPTPVGIGGDSSCKVWDVACGVPAWVVSPQGGACVFGAAELVSPAVPDDIWVLDSGSTCHLAKHRDDFRCYSAFAAPVTLEGALGCTAYGVGTVLVEFVDSDGAAVLGELAEVLYVPDITHPVFSQPVAQSLGAVFTYTVASSTLTTPGGVVLPVLDLPDGRYGLRVEVVSRRGLPQAGGGPLAFHARAPPSASLRPTPRLPRQHAWLLDSGASAHMVTDRRDFTTYTPLQPPIHIDGVGCEAVGEGSVRVVFSMISGTPLHATLDRVLHLPALATRSSIGVSRLFSQRSAQVASGAAFIFDGSQDRISLPAGDVPIYPYHRHLYMLSSTILQGGAGAVGALSGDVVTVAFFGARMPSESDRMVWHRRLGHLHDRGMQALLQSPAIGLQYTKGALDFCDACALAKSKVAAVPRQLAQLPTQPMAELHVDFKGRMPVTAIGSIYYSLGYTCAATGATWLFNLSSKTGALRTVAVMAATARAHGHRIITLRLDSDPVFLAVGFRDALAAVGVVPQYACPYAHWQDGLAERRWLTLVDSARAMLSYAQLPLQYWALALATAAYVRNRVWDVRRKCIPFTAVTGQPPDLSVLRVFGCLWVWVLGFRVLKP